MRLKGCEDMTDVQRISTAESTSKAFDAIFEDEPPKKKTKKITDSVLVTGQNGAKDDVKGTVIEKTANTEEPSQEQKAAKAAANQKQQQEVAAMKAAAQSVDIVADEPEAKQAAEKPVTAQEEAEDKPAAQPKEAPQPPEIKDKYKKYFKSSTAQLQKIYNRSAKNPEKQEAIKQIMDYKNELARVEQGDFTLTAQADKAKARRIADKNAIEHKFSQDVADAIAKSDTAADDNKYVSAANKRLEHVKQHTAYLTRKEYKEARREAKDDGISRKEFKEHNSYIKSKKVREYVKNNFINEDGEIDQQALKDHNFQYAGADFKLNYGIDRKHHNGSLSGHELDQVKTDTGLSTRQAKQLMKAGGYETEKSDKAKKVALAALAGIPGGGLVGAGLGAGAGALTKLTATATAEIISKPTGQILASETSKAVTSLTLQGLAAGSVIGAVVGAIVAAATTATTYYYDGQRDIINGADDGLHGLLDVKDENGELKSDYQEWIVKNLTEGLEGEDLRHGQFAAEIINGLLATGIPPKSIEYALKVARGNKSGENINLEELTKAAEALKYMAENGIPFIDDNCTVDCNDLVAKYGDKDAGPTDEAQGPGDGDKKTDEAKGPKDETKPDGVGDKKDGGPDAGKVPAKDGKTTEPTMVTVKNGESFRALARKYGVPEEQIKELNKNKIHGHTDCPTGDCKDGKSYTYFRVGERIVLPAGANEDAVRENQKVKSEEEIAKYTKATTSPENIRKLVMEDDCDKVAKAQGTQVYKLYTDARAEIKNLIDQLRSDSLSDGARKNAEARFKAITGQEPPTKEQMNQIQDFNDWYNKSGIGKKILQKAMAEANKTPKAESKSQPVEANQANPAPTSENNPSAQESVADQRGKWFERKNSFFE